MHKLLCTNAQTKQNKMFSKSQIILKLINAERSDWREITATFLLLASGTIRCLKYGSQLLLRRTIMVLTLTLLVAQLVVHLVFIVVRVIQLSLQIKCILLSTKFL